MVPPVLIVTTFGRSGLCGGSGGDANVGFVPLPIFSIFTFGARRTPDVVAAFHLDDDVGVVAGF